MRCLSRAAGARRCIYSPRRGASSKFSEECRTFQPVAAHPTIEIVGAAAEISPADSGERVSPVGNTARQWVDLRHDVTVSDIELAVRENFTAVEHIKRYTTLGMSVDQGKVGQAPAIEVIARARGVSPSELGHTTFRPPVCAGDLGHHGGPECGRVVTRHIRRTPLYALQATAAPYSRISANGKRAAAFPRAGESRECAMHREVQLVRNGVGCTTPRRSARSS